MSKKPRKRPPSVRPPPEQRVESVTEQAALPPAAEPAQHMESAAEAAPIPPAPSPGNMGALLEAQASLARGLARMSEAMLGLTRETMQGAAETGLALIDSRSLPSAWALGMQLARDHVDRLWRGSAELTDIGLHTATATCGPLLYLTWARIGSGDGPELS